MHNNYPSADDLKVYLATPGLPIPATIDYQSKVDAAAQAFETAVGWYPALAVGGASIRYFDPPSIGPSAGRVSSVQGGKELDLDGGLLKLVDNGVRIGVVPGFSGTPLTANLQFYMGPNNAHAMGLTHTYITFLTAVRGVPRSISVEGVWGRFERVPDDVWFAILGKAAADCVPELALAISKGEVLRKVGDVEKRFAGGTDAGPLAQQTNYWQIGFNTAVKRWKRVMV